MLMMGVGSAEGSDVGTAELGVSLSAVSHTVGCTGFASGKDTVASSPEVMVVAGFSVSGVFACMVAVC